MKKTALSILLLLLFVIFFVELGYFLARPGALVLGGTAEKMRKSCYEPILGEFKKEAWNYDVGQIQKYIQGNIETTGDEGYSPELIEVLRKSASERDINLMMLKRGESVKRVRDYYLKLLQLRVDLANCYESEAGNNKNYAENIRAMKESALEELKRGGEFDFDGFLRQIGKSVTQILSLEPNEEKKVRLMTSCLDFSSGPPQAGEKYFLISNVDETGDLRYCLVLRRAKTYLGRSEVQTAAWAITFDDSWSGIDLNTVKEEEGKSLGVPSLYDFYRKGEVGVLASSPGTVYDIDLVLKNYSSKKVEFDTSCLQFVPAFVYTKEQLDFFKGIAGNYMQFYGQYASGAGVLGASVLGEEDALPEPVAIPVATPKIPKSRGYSQPLGSSGVVGDAAPFVEGLEMPELMSYDFKNRAIENLDKSMRNFEKNPTEENFNSVMDDFRTCQEARCPNLGATMERIDKMGKKVMTRQGLKPRYDD